MREIYKQSIYDQGDKHICSAYPCPWPGTWAQEFVMAVFFQDGQQYVTKTYLCINHANNIRIKNEEEKS